VVTHFIFQFFSFGHTDYFLVTQNFIFSFNFCNQSTVFNHLHWPL